MGRMITVNYSYKNKFGEWCDGESYFQSIRKAEIFIKYVLPRKKYTYMGFSADSYEETMELTQRL